MREDRMVFDVTLNKNADSKTKPIKRFICSKLKSRRRVMMHLWRKNKGRRNIKAIN